MVSKKWNQLVVTPGIITRLKPLQGAELVQGIQLPAFAAIALHWKQTEFFKGWFEADDHHDLNHESLLEVLVQMTFAPGKELRYYYPGDTEAISKERRLRACKFLLDLAVTPKARCPSYDVTSDSLKNPTLLELLLLKVHQALGPVAKLYTDHMENAKEPAPEATPPPAPFSFPRKTTPPPHPLAQPNPSEPTMLPDTTTLLAGPKPQPPREAPPHRTYFNLSVPGHQKLPPGNDGWRKRDEIIQQLIPAFLLALHLTDPIARLLKFPSIRNTRLAKSWLHHYSPLSFLPKSKNDANLYWSFHWLAESGERSNAKILIAHKVPLETLLEALKPLVDFDNCWVDETEGKFFLTKSFLQVADVVQAGWLYGSSRHTNTAHLGDALNAIPELATNNIQVELRYKYIQSTLGESVAPSDKTFAIHVFCDPKNYHKVVELLNRVYNKSRKYNFPLEKKFQFVPDVATKECNLKDAASLATHHRYKEEQAIYLQGLTTIELRGVITDAGASLDPCYDITLYGAVAGLHDKRNMRTPVFASLDQHGDDASLWILSVTQLHREEAEEVAQKLGVLFSHQLGPKAWSAWFTKDYRLAQGSQFKYDEDLRKYVARGSEVMKDLRQTPLFRNTYHTELPPELENPCVISQLCLQLPSSFRTKSVGRQAEGAESASGVSNQQEIIETVYSEVTVEEEDWANLDDFDTEARAFPHPIAINDAMSLDTPRSPTSPTHQRSSQSVVSIKDDDDSSMGEESSKSSDPGEPLPVEFYTLTETLETWETSLPHKATMDRYPCDPAEIHPQFEKWYEYRANEEGDENEINIRSKDRQASAFFFLIVSFRLDPKLYFKPRMTIGYSWNMYEATEAWTHLHPPENPNLLQIPVLLYPPIATDDVFHATTEAWFWHDKAVDRGAMHAFLQFDSTLNDTKILNVALEIEEHTKEEFGAYLQEHLRRQKGLRGQPYKTFHTLEPRAEGEYG